jgi:hypothetical protein
VSKRWILWLLVAYIPTAGCFLAVGLGAAYALDLNGIKVTPSVGYQGEYDDNVFRTRSDKRSDYAHHVIPAITVEATPGNHTISAGFKADIIRWVRFENNDSDRYTANLDSVFQFNRLQLRLKEDFVHTDEFPSSELTQRIRRNDNALGGGFDYDVAQFWGIGFDHTWRNVYYLDHDFDFLSRNEYTYAANIYYRLTTKTRVFAGYDFVQEWFEFDSTRNDNRHRGLLGVRGDLTERLSLTARGGYERLTFLQGASSDQDNFVISLEASYKPVDRLQIVLLLSQQVAPSSFAGNAVYTTSSATLGITYAFTPKITIIPRGSFGADQYRTAALNAENNVTEKRLDYIYGGGLGIRYELQRWIRLDMNYDYQGRNSNFNASDYDDNRVSFTVTLSI